jgi:hypothetical protein
MRSRNGVSLPSFQGRQKKFASRACALLRPRANDDEVRAPATLFLDVARRRAPASDGAGHHAGGDP